MKRSILLLSFFLLVSLLVTACGDSSSAAQALSDEPGLDLSDELLANLEYKTLFSDSGVVRLHDGSYGQAAAAGSDSQASVSLTEFVARGQVSDVPNAAAVVLVSNPGGSGTFYELAVVIQSGGQAKNVGSYLLGDRVRINSVAIEDGQIQVDMYTQGPDDPLCCPNQHVLNTYSLNVNELLLTASELVDANTATVPVELTGTTWQWTGVFTVDSEGETHTQDIPDSSRYTLSFAPNEQVGYQADCSQGGGTYSTEGERLSLQIGRPADPGCPGDSHARDLLQYLPSVISFSLEQDQLTLQLDAGEGYLTLIPGEAQAATPTISISSPAPDSPVDAGQLLFVSGSASGLYEASLAVRVLDGSGNLLVEEPLSLQGENVAIGAPGTWSASLSLEGAGDALGQIVVYATGPQDDTWIAQASQNVQLINP